MKEEKEKNEEKILLAQIEFEDSVFYPYEGGGTFPLVVSDPSKNNAALNK